MLLPGPILNPGSVDDLVADACRAGQTCTPSMIHSWQKQGLLDYPQGQRGRGRGKGRDKSLFSANQRKLFRELIRMRAGVGKIATLACVPVYLWAYWGDEYVPLQQTRRAMRTHLKAFANPSIENSEHLATQLVDQFAHPSASDTARRKAVRLSADAMHSGRGISCDLEDALLRVYDPEGTGRQAGPPGVPVDIAALTRNAILREPAVQQLIDADDSVPDAIFQLARERMSRGLTTYLRDRPSLAAQAGDMAAVFAQPTATQIVQDSCSTLTGLIGLGLAGELR